MPQRKIVVFEDEPELLDLIDELLTRAGFQVISSQTGRGAMDFILQNTPELVIMDVMLPGMDGYTLSSKMASNPETHGTPVIVMTALEQSRPLFENLPNVKAFMLKPFRLESFMETVKTSIGAA